MSTMKVLAFPVCGEGVKMELDFEGVQKYVCGYVQAINLSDTAVLLCNEEGKNMCLAPNRMVMGDLIVGRFVIVGCDGGDDFCDISDADFAKYKKELDSRMITAVFHDDTWYPEDPENAGKTFLYYDLLQCKRDVGYKFFGYSYAQGKIRKEDYEKVYHSTVWNSGNKMGVLESLFEAHNIRICDCHGHSMSVSDVVVLYTDEGPEYYFVDSFGFKKLEKFE